MRITVQYKYDTLAFAMDESFRRRWAGCEALAMGRGGVSAVAKATGMSRNTVMRGIEEIQEQLPELVDRMGSGRIRRPGGGRHRCVAVDASLLADLQRLLESTTRGDPDSPLLWTCKSTRGAGNGTRPGAENGTRPIMACWVAIRGGGRKRDASNYGFFGGQKTGAENGTRPITASSAAVRVVGGGPGQGGVRCGRSRCRSRKGGCVSPIAGSPRFPRRFGGIDPL